MCGTSDEIQNNSLSYSCSSSLMLKDTEFKFQPQFGFQLNSPTYFGGSRNDFLPHKRQIKSEKLRKVFFFLISNSFAN